MVTEGQLKQSATTAANTPATACTTHARTCEMCKKKYAGGRNARFCVKCRPLRRKRTCKYHVGERERAIFEELYDGKRGCSRAVQRAIASLPVPFGQTPGRPWPLGMIRLIAYKLGIANPKQIEFRDWTEEEMEFLTEWQGRRSPAWIGRKLGRSERSVIHKLQRAGMGCGFSNGYTLSQMMECFGVSAATIHKWIDGGKLIASRQETDREHDTYRISDEALKAFIKKHPTEYRLGRVDQLWFLGFLLGELGDKEERCRDGVPPEMTDSGRRKRTLSMRDERGAASTSGMAGMDWVA